MATTTADNIQIIGGVDTHQDLHTAAVVSHDGTVLGTASFSTTRAGPVNGGAKLVHPGGAKLVHLTLCGMRYAVCGTRCWGGVPVVHRRDPRCFV